MSHTIDTHQNQNSQLAPNHWHEWVVNSAVDPILTALNVRSLSGSEVYEYLLYALPQTARRNDGRLRDGYLKRYAHAESGAWWVSGLDPLNDWLPMDWGRMKPDYPRLEWDKQTQEQTQKPVKYESPPKTPNRVTYLRVPLHIWKLIALRYDVPMPEHITVTEDGEALGFWAWVMAHPEIPVCLTEGEKKASCLLTLGFVAIALPGIWNGRVGKEDLEYLHPDLVPMAQQKRKFVILFDYETKPKTKQQEYLIIPYNPSIHLSISPDMTETKDIFFQAIGIISGQLILNKKPYTLRILDKNYQVFFKNPSIALPASLLTCNLINNHSTTQVLVGNC